MAKKEKQSVKKIVTIYLNNPHEPMIRVCLDNKETSNNKPNEFRTFKNSLMNGIPGVINDPIYVSVMNEDHHLLKDPKKGLSIIVSPRDWSHFYTEDYRPLEAKK